MSVRAIVAYPYKASAVFNIDYYLTTHMPLVAKLYGPFGLRKWEVIQFSAESSTPEFAVQTILHWDNFEQLAKANASEAAKTLGDDIPNFSQVMPIALSGTVVREA